MAWIVTRLLLEGVPCAGRIHWSALVLARPSNSASQAHKACKAFHRLMGPSAWSANHTVVRYLHPLCHSPAVALAGKVRRMSAEKPERQRLGFLLLPLQGPSPGSLRLSLDKPALRLSDGCADASARVKLQCFTAVLSDTSVLTTGRESLLLRAR